MLPIEFQKVFKNAIRETQLLTYLGKEINLLNIGSLKGLTLKLEKRSMFMVQL